MSTRASRALLIGLIAIAAVLAWHLYDRLYANRGQLVVTRDAAAPDTLVLTWHHEIKLPMAKLIADAFAANKAKVKRFVIDLDSPGGSLDEGSAVIAAIDEMKKTRQVDTRVSAGHDCLSMCVPIFLQGQRRMASASSRWLFHAPRSVDYFSGKDVASPTFEHNFYAQRYFNTYFRQSPIDPQWLARNEPLFARRNVWLSGLQLFEEHANIITELL